MYSRTLDIKGIKRSFFLFGPRQTGKSTLITASLADIPHLKIDLLSHFDFLRYSKNPDLFREEVRNGIRKGNFKDIFVDEIQKLPVLLDEVHLILEEFPNDVRFILTGSSARKLKHAGVNLLAGRAWRFFLFPLTHAELGQNFNLNRALRFGTLPPVSEQTDTEAQLTLDAYTEMYLKEEIAQEALVRNLGSFNRFLELAAHESGNIINFSNIAGDVGVSEYLIKSYYQILEDTLISLTLSPFTGSARKRIARHPKVYLFDLGVVNAFTKRLHSEIPEGTELYGKLFEHFIILELKRQIEYHKRQIEMFYLRLHTGLEIDLILKEQDKITAVEIKSSSAPQKSDVRHLLSFKNEFTSAKLYCICNTPRPYEIEGVEILPWRDFFAKLGLV